jgi:dihydrofolate reductase
MNVLYMAISRDGFIAGPHDETPWSDASWEAFQRFVLTCDVVLLGRRTFEIMQAADEFVQGPEYIVVTDQPDFDAGIMSTLAIKSRASIPEAERVGIIGGGELNGRLVRMGAIDEMILDIESIDLNAGTRLFGAHDVPLKLELVNSRQLSESTVQRHYRIVK